MLENKTRKTIMARHVIDCRSVWEKSIGLMFSSRKKIASKALIFYFDMPQRISIHMFFVFYPIDVIWLDENKQVVESKTLFPFTAYYPKCKSAYVLECDKEIIKKTGTQKGDLIEW